MILHCRIRTLVKLLLSGCLISLSSCSFDEPGEKVESYLTLQLRLPENNASDNETPVGTRAGDEEETGIADESKITRLKYFIYSSSTTLEQYQEVIITNGSADNPMWDSSNNALRITLTTGTKDIYCVANWIDNTAGMVQLNNDTPAARTQAGLIAFTRSHTNNMPVNPPVMTGKETVTLTGAEQDLRIYLKRQIAAVEIMPMISTAMDNMDANISIEGIKFRNMPQNSYLFPNTSGPSFAAWHQGAFDEASSGLITATTTDQANAVGMYQNKRFYIPEHYGTSATPMQMIIKAKYMYDATTNPNYTYYKIDLCHPDDFVTQNAAEHPGYVVQRNHIYRYYITIQGKGADSESAAYSRAESTDGSGINNITCELEIK